MLRIHILNVGHGDSIVLEYRDGGSTSFAVIDSNCKVGSIPPALTLLQNLGATSLSFVAITHPHVDHYMGMRAILDHFGSNVGALYTFPIKQEKEYIKNVIEDYKKYSVKTDFPSIQKQGVELAWILQHACTVLGNRWHTPTGELNRLMVQGFGGVSISVILPPSRVKGKYFQNILNGEVEPGREDLNDLSMGFLIEYGGKQIVLGGDGTRSNWIFQNKQWQRGGLKFSPVAVKLPHHGAKLDCDEIVRDVLFGVKAEQQAEAVACISANGKSHPATEVLNGLIERGIAPYCTNLATRCGNTVQSSLVSEETDPALLRFIGSAAVDREDDIRPCQGNIILELSAGQPLNVVTEHHNLCALRGDLSFLSGAVQ